MSTGLRLDKVWAICRQGSYLGSLLNWQQRSLVCLGWTGFTISRYNDLANKSAPHDIVLVFVLREQLFSYFEIAPFPNSKIWIGTPVRVSNPLCNACRSKARAQYCGDPTAVRGLWMKAVQEGIDLEFGWQKAIIIWLYCALQCNVGQVTNATYPRSGEICVGVVG